jgi:hypothetical protein
MKLCSGEAKCGYSPPSRIPELILEISKDYDNKYNEEKIKEIVIDFIKGGYKFTFGTTYHNAKNKNSVKLILVTAKDKSIMLFSNSNQSEDFTSDQLNKITYQLHKKLSTY